MTYLIINVADNSILAGPVDTLPDPLPGESYSMITPLSFGTEMIWSADAAGFIPSSPPVAMMPVGRFKLLLSQAERIGFRAAAKTDEEVADYLDLLAGFTDGISLSDPMLSQILGRMESKGLLAAGRVDAIVAGEPPASI